MATREELKRIADRAAEDEAFAARLNKDPIAVLLAEGLTLSEGEKKKIKDAQLKAESGKSRKAAADALACYIIVV